MKNLLKLFQTRKRSLAYGTIFIVFFKRKIYDGLVDETRGACKLCPAKTILKYSGNTTNLTDDEVSIVCKNQVVSKHVLQYFALMAADSSS